MNALNVFLVLSTAVSVALAVGSVIQLRSSRDRWQAKASAWHMDEARRIVIEVEYSNGERKILAEREVNRDESSVRALDRAMRDLRAASAQ